MPRPPLDPSSAATVRSPPPSQPTAWDQPRRSSLSAPRSARANSIVDASAAAAAATAAAAAAAVTPQSLYPQQQQMVLSSAGGRSRAASIVAGDGSPRQPFLQARLAWLAAAHRTATELIRAGQARLDASPLGRSSNGLMAKSGLDVASRLGGAALRLHGACESTAARAASGGSNALADAVHQAAAEQAAELLRWAEEAHADFESRAWAAALEAESVLNAGAVPPSPPLLDLRLADCRRQGALLDLSAAPPSALLLRLQATSGVQQLVDPRRPVMDPSSHTTAALLATLQSLAGALDEAEAMQQRQRQHRPEGGSSSELQAEYARLVDAAEATLSSARSALRAALDPAALLSPGQKYRRSSVALAYTSPPPVSAMARLENTPVTAAADARRLSAAVSSPPYVPPARRPSNVPEAVAPLPLHKMASPQQPVMSPYAASPASAAPVKGAPESSPRLDKPSLPPVHVPPPSSSRTHGGTPAILSPVVLRHLVDATADLRSVRDMVQRVVVRDTLEGGRGAGGVGGRVRPLPGPEANATARCRSAIAEAQACLGVAEEARAVCDSEPTPTNVGRLEAAVSAAATATAAALVALDERDRILLASSRTGTLLRRVALAQVRMGGGEMEGQRWKVGGRRTRRPPSPLAQSIHRVSKDRLRQAKARTRAVCESLEAHKAAAFASGSNSGRSRLRAPPFADGAPETDWLQVSVEAAQALLKHTESTGTRLAEAIRACAATASELSPRSASGVPGGSRAASDGDDLSASAAADLRGRLEHCLELEADFAMESARAAAAAADLEWTKAAVARARVDALAALEEVAAHSKMASIAAAGSPYARSSSRLGGTATYVRRRFAWALQPATLTAYEHRMGSRSLAAALVDAPPLVGLASCGKGGSFPQQRLAPTAAHRCSRTAQVRPGMRGRVVALRCTHPSPPTSPPTGRPRGCACLPRPRDACAPAPRPLGPRRAPARLLVGLPPPAGPHARAPPAGEAVLLDDWGEKWRTTCR